MRKYSNKIWPVAAKLALVVALFVTAQSYAFSATISQYASSVLSFSSQYTPTNWSAYQALGASDTFVYGESPKAWAPKPMDGSQNEFISLGFTTPVFATGLTIRETLGTGFVYKVEFLDTTGAWHLAWTGVDPSPRISFRNRPTARPAEFQVPFSTTLYKVAGVKIWVDTNTTSGVWEEIDSVKIVGVVPEAGFGVMMLIGILCVAGCRLFQKS
jgi:hypothetical protein